MAAVEPSLFGATGCPSYPGPGQVRDQRAGPGQTCPQPEEPFILRRAYFFSAVL
jgi:hypothetical protein